MGSRLTGSTGAHDRCHLARIEVAGDSMQDGDFLPLVGLVLHYVVYILVHCMITVNHLAIDMASIALSSSQAASFDEAMLFHPEYFKSEFVNTITT
jgi:hypothetical protein